MAPVRQHFLIRIFAVLWLFCVGIRAGPMNSIVSVPLEEVKPDIPSIESLPSVVVQQQHANRGIRRLARMKGEAPPRDHDLLGEIYNRLAGLSKNSEFMQKLEPTTLMSVERRPSQGSSNSTEPLRPITPSADRFSSTASTAPNSLGLEIQSHDVGYIAKLSIGTPPRNFSLLLDSGSADFWVGGEGCRGGDGQNCGNHTYLGSSTSSTFKDLHKTWAIDYNTGEVSGTIVQDDISIAGLYHKGFKFGIAFAESSEFTGENVSFDGLAGLASSSVSRQRTITLVESLRKSRVIRNSIVSLKIPRLADNKQDGEMTLGGMNPLKYDARSIVVVKNVNEFGFWETPINQVKVGGKPMGWTNRTGVLDTGTALLVAPREDVDVIHSQVPGAKKIDGSWTVPCGTKATLSLTIGNIDFSIDPRDLAFIPVDANKIKGDCWSGISIGTVGPFQLPTTWLLGNTFLKNVYHSMNADKGKNEITFAKLK